VPPVAESAELRVLVSVCVKRLGRFSEGTLLSEYGILKEREKCKKGAFKLS